jgi:hypothetical protein
MKYETNNQLEMGGCLKGVKYGTDEAQRIQRSNLFQMWFCPCGKSSPRQRVMRT